MLRILFIVQLLLFASVLANAQHNYSLVGKVEVCYEASLNSSFQNQVVTLVLQSFDTNQEHAATADATGEFKFDQIPSGTYKLSSPLLGFPDNDSTIIVDENTSGITFCIDKAYRPAPADSIANYRARAKEAIKAGNIKIYEWTAWSITEDPFKAINPKVKKKYGYEYEMMGCVRQTTREEILQVKLWQAYNEEVYQHLATIHGPDWRRTIKHERNKMRKE